MPSILELYDSMQSELGVDKISYAAAVASKTPYSDDDNFDADDSVLSEKKLKQGRHGIISNVKYSDTVDRG